MYKYCAVAPRTKTGFFQPLQAVVVPFLSLISTFTNENQTTTCPLQNSINSHKSEMHSIQILKAFVTEHPALFHTSVTPE